jgi:hypothetical protein
MRDRQDPISAVRWGTLEYHLGHVDGLTVVRILYFAGRGLQLAGMWLLVIDILTAGPMGPAFNLFVAGIVVFVAGWLLVRRTSGRRA